jgi:D-glycerate 3-kinase
VVAPGDLDRFLRVHRLPESFRRTADKFYLPVVDWLASRREAGSTFLLGINGAQGTGKSTLADFVKLALETTVHKSVAVLSIDDFYMTKGQRQALANKIHPLLSVRGVPGTHDLVMLETCLRSLRELAPGVSYCLPRFDKASDDRADESTWPTVTGPVDVIILEGWCVGSIAQPDTALAEPLNVLERERDPDGTWRRYVNDRLATDYAALFAELDALIFLRAPSFDAIYRWRLEQEQKLAATRPSDTSGIMDERQIAEFIQYYERITRNNLDHIGNSADIVLELDEYHQFTASRFRS